MCIKSTLEEGGGDEIVMWLAIKFRISHYANFEKLNIYTVLQKYAYIELKRNLLRSITLDIITRLLDNAAFVCVHPVGRFSKDFSEVSGLRSRGFQHQVKRWQQYCIRNYEKKCKEFGEKISDIFEVSDLSKFST